MMIKSACFYKCVAQHTIFLLKINPMRLISNRISVDETNSFSIVILAKVERWKESLLLFWVLAWTFCGVVFLSYFFSEGPFHHSLPMLIMISFWLYFEVRIVKVFFWRRKGFEHIQFKEDEIPIKNNLYGRGKERRYGVNEIDAIHAIPYSSRNFFAFMEDSFWVIGGDRVYFDYFGKKVVFGKQLEELEVKKLLSLLNGQLKNSKREFRKKMKQNEQGL